jgi:putative ABC transport system permease protein
MFNAFFNLTTAVTRIRRSRGFSCAVMVALTLAIGVNSAVFTVINSTLLQPLPYSHLEDLNTIRSAVSYTQFRDWRDGLHERAEVSAYRPIRGDLIAHGLRQRDLWGCVVSPNLFGTLRVKELMGRVFSQDDERSADVVLLSYKLWRDLFDSDAGVLGKEVQLNGRSYMVVGVMGKSFGFPDAVGQSIAFWIPLAEPAERSVAEQAVLHVIVRVGRARRMDVRGAMGTMATRGHMTDLAHLELVPVDRGLRQDVRLGLLLSWAASSLLLLLTCGTVAGLYLVRATRRQAEISIRLALGASRSRVVAELLVESLLLATAAAIAGLFLAAILTTAALRSLPAGIVTVDDIHVDGRMFAFTAATALLSAVIFGLLPAFRCSNIDCASAIRESASQTFSRSIGSGQASLILLQTAITLILLIGAGLLIRTLERLWAVPLGFQPDHLLVFGLELPRKEHLESQQWETSLRRVRLRVREVAGVTEVGGTNALPFWGYSMIPVRINRSAPRPAWLQATVVTQGYFAAMRIPLLRGRDFLETDGTGALRTVIVDSRMEAKYWPHGDPIGQPIVLGGGGEEYTAVIVGVVEAIRQRGFTQDAQPTVYIPYRQLPSPGIMLVIRTSDDPTTRIKAVLSAAQETEPDAVLFDVSTMHQVLSKAVAPQEAALIILGAFGFAALIVAVLSIYGFVAYTVKQRTREIGIRLAIGARGDQAALMIIRQTLWPMVVGILIGLLGAMAATRFTKGLLFGITSLDPLTFALGAASVLCAGLSAGCVAALQVVRVNPMLALRHD